MEDGNNGNNSLGPVFKPRRHIMLDNELNGGKKTYENISIDSINKNFDIKNENLQNNAKIKVLVNKAFMLPSSPPLPTLSTSALNDAHLLTKLDDLQSTSKDLNRNLAIALHEVNKLRENAKQKAVTAPRRSNASSLERDNNSASTSSLTGTNSKISKKNVYPFWSICKIRSIREVIVLCPMKLPHPILPAPHHQNTD